MYDEQLNEIQTPFFHWHLESALHALLVVYPQPPAGTLGEGVVGVDTGDFVGIDCGELVGVDAPAVNVIFDAGFISLVFFLPQMALITTVPEAGATKVYVVVVFAGYWYLQFDNDATCPAPPADKVPAVTPTALAKPLAAVIVTVYD